MRAALSTRWKQIFPAAALKLICSKEPAPMLASIDSKPIHKKDTKQLNVSWQIPLK
jgi:hypothetical protein